VTPGGGGEEPAAGRGVLTRTGGGRLRAESERRHPVDILRIIIAIILPPLGVFLQVGIGGHFWLNILLTLLGYIPGIVHALYVILSR
jgi:uncharacterized membrane protein YqaE (UPF0057 family)